MKKVFLFAVLFLSVHYSKASTPTDYFRSAASGDWTTVATWQSSADNTNWVAATLTPTITAKNIYIRNGHSVNASTNLDIDQVLIESGGILSHIGGALTINDGVNDDLMVAGGGVFTLASASNPPLFAASTATAIIDSAAILRISTTGLTDAAPNPGVNVLNYFFQNGSVLEYTPSLAFSTAGVTYFPNAAAGTIPVFRTTSNIGLVGGVANTVINGVFEANGNITFQNSGTKTFRNGIIGTGNINGATSGKFMINGATAILGGTGTLTVPTATGMDIGNGTSCNMTLTSDKTVTNNIALINNTYVYLFGNNLVLNGAITNASPTAHVVTPGLGKLIINNVSAAPAGFPVGAAAGIFNPMYIYNAGGFSYGVRVEIGINPAIAVPLNAVNRTWFVTPSGGTPGTVNTNFFYYAGHGNAGFNYTTPLELGHYTGVWNVIQTGLNPAGSYQVATTVSTFGNNIEAPLVLGNLGAILASYNSIDVNYFTGLKQNAAHVLKWKLGCNNVSTVNMVIERSTDGRNYVAVYSEDATALRCEQPFSFNDNQPAAGINYYRIKMTDDAGKLSYSSIVTLINATKGIDVMSIAPNPVVNGSFNLKISAAQRTAVHIQISDIQGRVLQKQNADLIAGFNSMPFDVHKLGKGSYLLAVNGVDGNIKLLRFVVQ